MSKHENLQGLMLEWMIQEYRFPRDGVSKWGIQKRCYKRKTINLSELCLLEDRGVCENLSFKVQTTFNKVTQNSGLNQLIGKNEKR